MGTVISGQAHLKFSGQGQEILVFPSKDYFVTYDMDYLATVDPSANVGLEIRDISYFKVKDPDIVESVNIGTTAPAGKSYSYIPRVNEYADVITFSISDQSQANYQQQTTSATVLTFIASANKADAIWRGMKVYAIGTSTCNNNVTEEVSRVKVWRDQTGAGQGSFTPDNDVLIGSAAFNTAGPLGADVRFYTTERVGTTQTRYFVTYDIHPTAPPTATCGGNVDTVQTSGARIDPGTSGSFPQNINDIDNSGEDYISEPNTVASFSQFSSGKGTIIPAPQTALFTPIPVFTSVRSTNGAILSQSIGTQIYHSPRLNGDLGNLSTDLTVPIWSDDPLLKGNDPTMVISTFPSYAIIDAEIVQIATRTTNSLVLAQRGILGTSIQTHSSSTVVGYSVAQSDSKRAFLKLVTQISTATGSAYPVQLSKIRLNRPTTALNKVRMMPTSFSEHLARSGKQPDCRRRRQFQRQKDWFRSVRFAGTELR